MNKNHAGYIRKYCANAFRIRCGAWVRDEGVGADGEVGIMNKNHAGYISTVQMHFEYVAVLGCEMKEQEQMGGRYYE